jgi:biopolymer transport protein ExbD
MLGPLAGIPGFGLLYGIILLLIAVPSAMIFTLMWGFWPWSHSVGLEVRIAQPATIMADRQEDHVIVSVNRVGHAGTGNEPEIRLNSVPVSWVNLRDALRAELSRRPDRVVYVEGHDNLEFADIVRVVDVTREAWYGVTVVLLTPKVKKIPNAQRGGGSADRSANGYRAR